MKPRAICCSPAREVRARVVFVGDRDQIPSIEAGRAFAMLADHGLSIATIDTIVRQKDPQLRRAVVKTTAREHEEAIDLLRPRVLEVPDHSDRLAAIARAFVESLDRRSTLVITPSNADWIALNELVRRELQERGLLGVQQIAAGILVRRDLTRAEAKDVVHYVAGYVVRFGRAYKRFDIEAKSCLMVKSVDASRGMITLEADDGRTIAWKPARASKVEVYRLERRTVAPGDLLRWTRNDEQHRRYNGGLVEVLSVEHKEKVARIRSMVSPRHSTSVMSVTGSTRTLARSTLLRVERPIACSSTSTRSTLT